MAEIALYYIRRGKYELSIKYIMDSLDNSVRINNESCIIKCVGMFEQLRHIASLETQKEYQNLLRINEKKNCFVIDSA